MKDIKIGYFKRFSRNAYGIVIRQKEITGRTKKKYVIAFYYGNRVKAFSI